MDGEPKEELNGSVAPSRGLGRSIKRGKDGEIPGLSMRAVRQVLEKTNTLTDSDFDSWLHDNWYRIALYVLARMGCAGDIKALELYLKRYDAHKASLDKPQQPRPIGTVSFIPAARSASVESEAPSTASASESLTTSDSERKSAIET